MENRVAKDHLGDSIQEEFDILMSAFQHKSPAFKDVGREFFTCGAMAALQLAARILAKGGDISEPMQALADSVMELKRQGGQDAVANN
jgi:hypothetical protein